MCPTMSTSSSTSNNVSFEIDRVKDQALSCSIPPSIAKKMQQRRMSRAMSIEEIDAKLANAAERKKMQLDAKVKRVIELARIPVDKSDCIMKAAEQS
ncbi:hypothetical protein BJ742DRAFT_851622 [Cladochytrium replicatum]|nr:hypothetical protein BJ742DRAFT_851622 [Cladochytrium replicatum]